MRGRLLWTGLLVLGVSASAVGQTKVITEGDTWKYFKGKEEPPADWNTLAFDDSAWLEGATPIGYSTDMAYKTVLDDMLQVAGGNPGYWSVFARKKFTVALADVKSMKLSIKIDDGFVAFVNGVEVARLGYTAGVPVTFDTAPATAAADPPTWLPYPFPCDFLSQGILKDGENVLAIIGGNSSLTSSDFSLDPELEIVTEVCPSSLTGTYAEATNRVTLRWTKPAGITSYEAYTVLRNGEEITPGPAVTAVTFIDRAPVAGSNKYDLTAVYCGTDCPTLTVTVIAGAVSPSFRRGDPDANGSVNITDAVNILGHLFQGQAAPSCMDAADADDNGQVNITDAVYLLQALFQGGPQPPAPGTATCGEDPAAGGDTLAACVYTAC